MRLVKRHDPSSGNAQSPAIGGTRDACRIGNTIRSDAILRVGHFWTWNQNGINLFASVVDSAGEGAVRHGTHSHPVTRGGGRWKAGA